MVMSDNLGILVLQQVFLEEDFSSDMLSSPNPPMDSSVSFRLHTHI